MMKFIEYTRSERVRKYNKTRIDKYGLFLCPVCKKKVEKIINNGLKMQTCSILCRGVMKNKSKTFEIDVIEDDNEYVEPAKTDNKTMLELVQGVIDLKMKELDVVKSGHDFLRLQYCLDNLFEMRDKLENKIKGGIDGRCDIQNG